MANDSQYGLTGAIYSGQCRSTSQKAREEFFVGNMYINRKCTGAFVGAHPFGGFQHVGDGFKSRRPGLLLLFLAGQADRGETLTIADSLASVFVG